MPIRVIDTDIKDIKIIETQVFRDSRGFFMESWKHEEFSEKICPGISFVQDNHSRSTVNVVRGLHYQLPPYAQAKLVRCLVGSIYDVAVDLRKNSPTFGKWVGVELSAENKRQLWIPEGFAHGFVALSDVAEVFYKTNAYWNKESEGSILWSDPNIGIQWPLKGKPIISEKDAVAPLLKYARVF